MLMRLVRCRRLSLEGITLRNAGAWCAHFLRCAHVRIHGITIFNRAKYNNDGIDLMGTENVTISDCILLCEDDAICLQDMFDDAPVRNVVITNCVMSTRWAAIRSGGAHRGGIRDVAVSNCVIHDTYGCGIKLQISGNGTMENMTFSNIVMNNVSSPISLRFGNHHYNNEQRDDDVSLRRAQEHFVQQYSGNVSLTTSLREGNCFVLSGAGCRQALPGEERQCISICGIPGHPVEGVTLSDIHVTYPGGGTREEAARRDLPELEDQYPEYFMFGVLPAYGLYARHVEGLTLNNVRSNWPDRTFDPPSRAMMSSTWTSLDCGHKEPVMPSRSSACARRGMRISAARDRWGILPPLCAWREKRHETSCSPATTSTAAGRRSKRRTGRRTRPQGIATSSCRCQCGVSSR